LEFQADRAQLLGEPALLQDAHAVLARDGAAQAEAEGHDFVEGLAGAP
jgi:hypothetical protein